MDGSDYYICFIDLMGQKNFFERITSREVSPDVMKDVERVSDGLRVMVKYVKNRYHRFFSTEDDVGIELFSDSLLLSMRFKDDAYSKLGAWLDVLVKLVYIACKYKLPFRGALTKGWAARSKSGTIYGVGVDEAVDLEQSRADFFRIVFSNTLARELGEQHSFDEYLDMDQDSAMVLNYAGPRLLRRVEFSRERSQLYGVGMWVKERFEYFCCSSDAEQRKHANAKLARRYKLWYDYLTLQSMKMYIKDNV